jgi:hypothetical protein
MASLRNPHAQTGIHDKNTPNNSRLYEAGQDLVSATGNGFLGEICCIDELVARQTAMARADRTVCTHHNLSKILTWRSCAIKAVDGFPLGDKVRREIVRPTTVASSMPILAVVDIQRSASTDLRPKTSAPTGIPRAIWSNAG